MVSTFGGIGEEEEEELEGPSDYDKEEDENEEEDMEDQNMDSMTQGPLTILGVLHKMKKHSEKLLTKYDPDNMVKVEDHLENFYLHMKNLRYVTMKLHANFFHVPWMVKQLYAITTFLQTPSRIRGGSRRSFLKNLLMARHLCHVIERFR